MRTLCLLPRFRLLLSSALAYSQCIPGAATTTAAATSTSAAPAPMSSCQVPAPSAGKLRFAGVNIAGFDFGCNSDGTCNTSGAWPPLTQYYGADSAGQMKHFVDDDGFNVFRLPVGWQFLTNDIAGGDINEDNWAEYDALVQACLDAGASCIVNVHNYARYNGEVRRSRSMHVKGLRRDSHIHSFADHWTGWADQSRFCSTVVQHRGQVCG